MKKLLIIGIDSLDPYVLQKYRDQLPNFSSLMAESPTLVTKSIFPVDTIPAWATIYTGLNPGKHGLLYVFDLFDANLSDLKTLKISNIHGKTVWDYASAAGKKVLLVYPMLLFPPWEINGAMISRAPYDQRVDWITTQYQADAFPKSFIEKYQLPDKAPGLWGGFPGLARLKEWADAGRKILDDDIAKGMEICIKEPWDVFFIYFNELDLIQHRIWRFFDQNDPTYPGKNEFEDIVLDFYKVLDKAVGDYIKAFPDAALMVVSDHGHGPRPLHTININEHLRQKKFLTPGGGRTKPLVNMAKNTGLSLANKLKLETFLIKMVVKNKQLTKATKSIYSSSGMIDKKKSKAYLSNFAGIKSYPHGGFEVNRDGMTAEEYEQTRSGLIAAIQELKTKDGKPVTEWAMSREDLYPGKHTAQMYPDVVFELKDGYGVGWDMFTGLYGKSHDHAVASGGHKADAVLLLRNIDRQVRSGDIGIVDIAPSIMDLLEIGPKDPDVDGKSIFT